MKDGTTIWLAISLSFLRHQYFQPVGILAVSRDISDRKRAEEGKNHLEEQLKQSQKLEAIELYRRQQQEINLVILDTVMPGISGGKTFDRLRDINPAIRILLSSGYSIEGQANQILSRGCNGFLQKPFILEDLSKKIREILDH